MIHHSCCFLPVSMPSFSHSRSSVATSDKWRKCKSSDWKMNEIPRGHVANIVHLLSERSYGSGQPDDVFPVNVQLHQQTLLSWLTRPSEHVGHFNCNGESTSVCLPVFLSSLPLHPPYFQFSNNCHSFCFDPAQEDCQRIFTRISLTPLFLSPPSNPTPSFFLRTITEVDKVWGCESKIQPVRLLEYRQRTRMFELYFLSAVEIPGFSLRRRRILKNGVGVDFLTS